MNLTNESFAQVLSILQENKLANAIKQSYFEAVDKKYSLPTAG